MKAVIELAKQVGMQGMLTDVVTTVSELERFSELVRADERKRLMAVAGEPVAWANPNDLQNFDMKVRTNGGPLHTVPLYTTPPQRKPLTLKQRVDLLAKFEAHKHEWHAPAILIDMVEAAHGIKE